MDNHHTAEEALQPLLTISGVFIPLCTICVALRFIARLHVKSADLGLDDLFIGLGYIVCMALCADGIIVRNIEVAGNPPADEPILEPSVLVPALKAIYAAEQLLYAGTALPKLSLLFLYLRIFDSRGIRFVTYGLIAFTFTTWLVWSCIAFFLCSPIQFYWNRLLPGGHCIDINTFWRSIPPFNIFSDIVAAALPIPTIWRLEASRMKKVGVIAILLTGAVGIITAAIRWSVYLKYSAATIVPSITTPELGWAIIEANMYLIASCLPMLRPIFVWLTPARLRNRWTREGDSSVYHRNITASSSKRYSQPFRHSKRESAFWRLEEQSVPSAQTSSIATPAEPKSPMSAGDIPLQDVDGISKTIDVSVTQSRMSESSGDVPNHRESTGRTQSFAEGLAAHEITTLQRL